MPGWALPAAVATVLLLTSPCFSRDDGFRFSTDSPRPLSDLIVQLNSHYNWSISFEEAPVVAPDDLIDITAPEYRDEGHVYKYVSYPVTVQTTLPDPAVMAKRENDDITAAQRDEKQAVEDMLCAYWKAGNRGSFAFVQRARYIDVFGDKVRMADGRYERFEPLLSTRVSIPLGTYSVSQILWMVCDQVAQKRGVTIHHGTIPAGMLLAISIHEQFDNEPARDVLHRVFE